MQQKPLLWILEDDDNARFVYNEILSPEYVFRFFGFCSEFISALAAADPNALPDLLITDLKLGDGNFDERLDDVPAGVRFLVVSAFDEKERVERCFDSGAADFLHKPFRKTILLTKIRRLLESGTRSKIPGLTKIEERVLKTLQAAKGPVAKKPLSEAVWGQKPISENTFHVCMNRLRKKLISFGITIVSHGERGWEITKRQPMGRLVKMPSEVQGL